MVSPWNEELRISSEATYPVRANLAAGDLIHDNHLDGVEVERLRGGDERVFQLFNC